MGAPLFDPWAGVDFDQLASKLMAHETDLIHRTPQEQQLHGAAFYAEALRRTITSPTSGLVSIAEAKRTVEAHTVVDRANRASAEKRVAELQAERYSIRATTLDEIADELDRAANNPNVEKSLYRRQGLQLAARMIRREATGERRVAASDARKTGE